MGSQLGPGAKGSDVASVGALDSVRFARVAVIRLPPLTRARLPNHGEWSGIVHFSAQSRRRVRLFTLGRRPLPPRPTRKSTQDTNRPTKRELSEGSARIHVRHS